MHVHQLQSQYTILREILCRGLLKDVPLRGVASAENAVYRRHYTGCVDNGREVGCLWTMLAIRQQSLKHETLSCKTFWI